MQLVRTGRKMAFLDVAIGQPFWTHNAFFVRTDFESGTKLMGSDWIGAKTFNFVADGTVHPERAARGEYYSHPGEACEEVEYVECSPRPEL